MSSLAFHAAPVNNNPRSSNVNKKRIAAQKKTPGELNTLMKSIHNTLPDDDGPADGESDAGSAADGIHVPPISGNFPPPPVSVGAENTREKDEQLAKAHAPIRTDMRNLSENYAADEAVRQNYNSISPQYASAPVPSYYSAPAHPTSNEVMLKKVNYLIHLMEEQRDERTGNVTEEVVLYSFLGVFVIFVVDSFVRVGKYVR